MQQPAEDLVLTVTFLCPDRLWNWGAVACGVANALLHAPQAWLGAPAAACRLQQQAPLQQRWHLLGQARVCEGGAPTCCIGCVALCSMHCMRLAALPLADTH